MKTKTATASKIKEVTSFSQIELLNIWIVCAATASLQCKSKIANIIICLSSLEMQKANLKLSVSWMFHTLDHVWKEEKKVLRLTFNLWTMSAWNCIFFCLLFIAFIWTHFVQLLMINVRYVVSWMRGAKKKRQQNQQHRHLLQSTS